MSEIQIGGSAYHILWRAPDTSQGLWHEILCLSCLDDEGNGHAHWLRSTGILASGPTRLALSLSVDKTSEYTGGYTANVVAISVEA